MIKKIIPNCLLISIIIFAGLPLFSFGQAAPTDPTGSFLEITISPENPEPFQNVQVTLQSFSYDLDRSTITWSVDGIVQKSDIGLKVFSTAAGDNGQKTTVKASVQTQADGIKEAEISFVPSVVDLIYEPLSYAPPFYKGRTLNPNQGVVWVTAIPNLVNNAGGKIPAQNIIYSWKKDGKVQQSDSGIGKNTFVFSGTVPVRDTLIEVTVSSLDGSISTSKQINITNVSPQIIFYENNPIYGIMFNKAITSSVNMASDEFSVIAMPYFFSASYAAAPDLDYVWNMNGSVVGNQDPKNSFTTRLASAASGTANIGLKISHNVRIFQFTDGSYSINFSKQ